jgi:hypothetical protein
VFLGEFNGVNLGFGCFLVMCIGLLRDVTVTGEGFDQV